MKNKINPFMCLMILILSAIVIVPALIFSNKSPESEETVSEETREAVSVELPTKEATEQPTEETVTEPETDAPEEVTETVPTTETNEVKRITSSFKQEYLTNQSPNAEFYGERLSVIGDSVAYGFDAYGYIYDYNNFAMESVSIWNFDSFTIDKGAGEMGLVDAAVYVNPSLIYMSLGMNDIGGGGTETFTKAYKQRIEQLLAGIPDVTIVVAAITPVTAECDYIDNAVISTYNQALYETVENMNSPQVYFFDAYYALAEPDTLNLPSEISGDGIHLSPDTYAVLLNALYNFLDDTSAMEQIKKCEAENGTNPQINNDNNFNNNFNNENTDEYEYNYDYGNEYNYDYGYDYNYDYGSDYNYYYGDDYNYYYDYGYYY
ncbi:MAG: SGNH/GDSL hydrolase family protein [Ruminococcus sp.]|nr:SGNH/GDSL hydrolase family protein [Ruminococcus sp.]